jgi:Lanthionine synthetase C-like protein
MPVSLSQSHTAIAAGYHDAGPGLNAALRTLTTIIGAHRGERPGWWLPAAAHPDGVAVPASGAATTGTAHGIAGPLALLSAAQSAGWTVTGQEHAITATARWLLHWREQPTSSWPPCISGDELDQRTRAGDGRHGTQRPRADPSRPRRRSRTRQTARTHMGRHRPRPVPRPRGNPPKRQPAGNARRGPGIDTAGLGAAGWWTFRRAAGDPDRWDLVTVTADVR